MSEQHFKANDAEDLKQRLGRMSETATGCNARTLRGVEKVLPIVFEWLRVEQDNGTDANELISALMSMLVSVEMSALLTTVGPEATLSLLPHLIIEHADHLMTAREKCASQYHVDLTEHDFPARPLC